MPQKMKSRRVQAGCVLFVLFLFAGNCLAERVVVSLDGAWQVDQGTMATPPSVYAHQAPVPGLLDMAEPAFSDVGGKSDQREAFWYRREFVIEGEIQAHVMLVIRKARYGTAVYLNGRKLADEWPCFTPLSLDVREYVKGEGQKNELLIRVGANRELVPESYPDGWDFEKMYYIPGIYDSVELIMTGRPYIGDVQVAPDIENRRARVNYTIYNPKKLPTITVQKTIFDIKTNQALRTETTTIDNIETQEKIVQDEWISMEGCRLWTPEEPYLYTVELKTTEDNVTVRFGMRSFSFDATTGRAMLNGQPYYMRGTNVCIYRFFEDIQRRDLPWRKSWVRQLHQKFKSMYWNSIRYCIGFPPDFWYDIADEEGFLIQDEFPIWHINNHWPAALKADELANEFTAWMQNRWNHPCVVIWDAQNETLSGGQTDAAIRRVRGLDLSNRPWDNGWDPPQAVTDGMEDHTYYFYCFQPPFDETKFAEFFGQPRVPEHTANFFHGSKKRNIHFNNAIIINEYGWLWLNRDGSETLLSKEVYPTLLADENTTERRRQLYARLLAAKTEYWRSHRKLAGVLHFCGLGYSRPGDKPVPQSGATSDHWMDVENLVLEPNFNKYVRDAFSPVGLMIDVWKSHYSSGETLSVPVAVINDEYTNWEGEVSLTLQSQDQVLCKKTAKVLVNSLGREVVQFSMVIPEETGHYQLMAELKNAQGETVHSIRDLDIGTKKTPSL